MKILQKLSSSQMPPAKLDGLKFAEFSMVIGKYTNRSCIG